MLPSSVALGNLQIFFATRRENTIHSVKIRNLGFTYSFPQGPSL